MSKTTSRLSSGKYIDLANLTPEDMDINDISNSLNWQFRFNGHHKDKVPLTVAQHTKLAMQIKEKLFPGDLLTKLDVLLHDWAEAYYGDIVSPIKSIIKDVYKPYAHGVDATLYTKWWPNWIEYTSEIYDRRIICDLTSLDFERRNMWSSQMGKENWPSINETFRLAEMRVMFDEVQAERFIDLPKMYDEVIQQVIEAYPQNSNVTTFKANEAY